MDTKNLVELIFIGRGGQGIVTAAQLAGAAAFKTGIKDVNIAPFFGAERRGAPVEAYLRLANQKINIYSNIEQADIFILFDDSLLNNINQRRVKHNQTKLLINSADAEIYKKLEYYKEFSEIAIINATNIAKSINLYVGGALIINTALIGALAKFTDLYDSSAIEKTFIETFGQKNSQKNIEAAKISFNELKIIKITE
ncbi:MAG TPA: 2-oxoacid:acceptor oxidoreductase family protein [bacterium]|nr:2-oxoacid:acceptor oxidoreductase family protein [bacterium]